MRLFTIDDLARKVGQQMERQAGNHQVASAVAKEFQAAGIAFADPGSASCTNCSGDCTPSADFECVDCDSNCASAPGKKKKPKDCNPEALIKQCERENAGSPIDCAQKYCHDCYNCGMLGPGTECAKEAACQDMVAYIMGRS